MGSFEPANERVCFEPTSEGKDMKRHESSSIDGAVDQSFELVNERMSSEPVNAKMFSEPVKENISFESVSERKKTKRQESSWTEGANLTDTLFLKSRIHVLNNMVNKVCGEIQIVRTNLLLLEEYEDVPEKVEDQEETEMYLNSIRLQQFCQLVFGVLHPDHHKERCVDDSTCEAERVHPHAVYVKLDEVAMNANATLEGPDSAELLHATSLVCRALHNTLDMSERKRPGSEATEESAKAVEFAQDSNLSHRVRVFDKLVRKSLQTENMERSASRKKP